MTPGALNPPHDRARRFLMPAASVLRNGAWKMGTVSQPALYPHHHLYVSEGSEAQSQDGTPEHPFGCLDDVLEDEGLRQVCAGLAHNYIHIHLKLNEDAALQDPDGSVQVFDGGGYDFKGHLVIENWTPGSKTQLSVSAVSTTVLPDISGATQEKAWESGFYSNRHTPVSGEKVDADIAVFRDFKGVLFHGFDIALKYSHGYSGYATDRFGNNTPTEKIATNVNLAVWKDCQSCGMHQCVGTVTTDITIGDMPDPYDIVNPEPEPEPEEDDDDEGGGGGGGGWGGGGSIGPGGGGGGGGWGGSGGIIFPDDTEEDVPEEDVFTLSPEGDMHLAASLVSSSAKILTREIRAEISCKANTIFGGIVYAEGFQNCGERYSLMDAVNATAEVRDREYVYSRTVKGDDGTEKDSESLSDGSAAAAYAYGEKGSHTSVLKKGTVSASASAYSSKSSKVDTGTTFGPTMATAVGYSGCTDPIKYTPLSIAVSAGTSCPWAGMSQEVQKQSE